MRISEVDNTTLLTFAVLLSALNLIFIYISPILDIGMAYLVTKQFMSIRNSAVPPLAAIVVALRPFKLF